MLTKVAFLAIIVISSVTKDKLWIKTETWGVSINGNYARKTF